MGAALANIARGAATGGLYGAAAGAAKSFLPEIAKGAVIIAVILLVLPTLIFTAVPNIIFGYDTAAAADIINLTDRAVQLDAAYKQMSAYSQSYIESMVAQANALYTPDETEVNSDLNNTNIYWFIAISSVAHRQDLYAMSESSIISMIAKRLSFSFNLFETEVGEGEAATILRTLKVDIRELDPEALMDKLGFSEEERAWAGVLYAALADEQYVGYGDTDGQGYYNTDYGDIIFTDTAIPVVYYNQTDTRWGNLSYGKKGTIGTSGCGPTALAIAVATFADAAITPAEVAAWAVFNGYRAEGMGSYHSLIPDGGAHYGLTVEGLGRDGKKVVEALESGKLVIAIMSKGHFTSGGHFIVLRGTTSGGKILVADPASIKRSNQSWRLSLIVSEANSRAGSSGPFWAIGPG